MARAYGRIIYKPPVRLYCAAIKAYVLPTCEFVVGISSFFFKLGRSVTDFCGRFADAIARDLCACVFLYRGGERETGGAAWVSCLS